MHFRPTELTADERLLQAEVREFLATELPPGSHEPGLGMAARHDREFSAKVAQRGWVGMALPSKWGGSDRTAVERFIVVEEMLRWGAPVGHHWVADRQTGNVINKFGTDEQRERFLPPICRGELGFSIGMSEPDSGSDLASVSTSAQRAEAGWLVNGTKVWTSNAHLNDWFICLLRTAPAEAANKHAGLSQFLIDLDSPGLEINPIPFLDGTHHFNEVQFTDVFVPDINVVGEPGMGWHQNTTEMAYERGGPDRWLSPFSTVEQLLRESTVEPTPPDRMPAISTAVEQLMCESAGTVLSAEVVALFGELAARWWGIRNLSLSVARLIDEGEAPSVESALVKELGTRFEQEVVERIVTLVDREYSPDSKSLFERMMAQCVLTFPGNTIRGGTIEILRSVAAKGLDGQPKNSKGSHEKARRAKDLKDSRGTQREAKVSHSADVDDIDPLQDGTLLLSSTLRRLFDEHCPHEAVRAAEANGTAPKLWDAFAQLGFWYISVPERSGGAGGTLADALEVLHQIGYYAAPIPAAETSLLGGWLLANAGLPLPDGGLSSDLESSAGFPRQAIPLTVPTLAVNRAANSVKVSATQNPGDTTEPFEVELNGALRALPWGRCAQQVVFLTGGPDGDASGEPAPNDRTPLTVVMADLAGSDILPARNMAGEPRDTAVFDRATATAVIAPPGIDHTALRLRGALSRVALMAGALRSMAQLTVSYTNERIQFGRPIARFQAIQQHLVWAAQEAALAEMSARCAGRSSEGAAAGAETAMPGAGNAVTDAGFEIAAAKLIANQAATRATKACHQAHGAMGMTQEYPLHHLSRRLWSWRQEYGGEAEWAQWLGTSTMSQGADGLYPLISSGKQVASGGPVA